jgi:hypothetical protein
MRTLGKVVDSTVIIGSLVVGYGGVNAIIKGSKAKNTAIITVGALTTLIALYAFREAIQKIKED